MFGSPASSEETFAQSQGGFSQLPVSNLPSSFVDLLGRDDTQGGDGDDGDGDDGDGDDDYMDDGDSNHSDAASEDFTGDHPRQPLRVRSLEVDDVNNAVSEADLDEWDSDDEDGVYEDGDEEAADPLDDAEEAEILGVGEEMAELVDSSFLASLGGAVRLASGQVDVNALRAMRWGPVTNAFHDDDEMPEYPDLTTSPGGPVPRLFDAHESPADLFFSFFPRSLWRHIAIMLDTSRERDMRKLPRTSFLTSRFLIFRTTSVQ